MKTILSAILLVISAIVGSVLIATLTVLWVVPADGKTFYEIITNIELVFRFIAAIITFGTLFVLFAWFVFFRLLFNILHNE